MIQAATPGGPHYAVQLARGVAAGTRLARPVQSAAAADLLAALRARVGIPAGFSSKAHTRALSAVAVSAADCVGIDAEFEAPERNICAIAGKLAHAAVRDAAVGYRVFTFYEAYFKATGAFPVADLLQAAAAASSPCYRTADGFEVLHATPIDGFALTLVWRGAGAAVRHEFPEQTERRL